VFVVEFVGDVDKLADPGTGMKLDRPDQFLRKAAFEIGFHPIEVTKREVNM
jgi:hypothetical protein